MFDDHAEGWNLDTSKLRRIRGILLGMRSGAGEWDFYGRLAGWPDHKKPANKWFLGCLLDYQMQVDRAWGNALLLAEDLLGDPPDLWERIDSIPEQEWMELCTDHSIHRFPQAYVRVRRIGGELLEQYEGDARQIWDSPRPDVVLERLMDLRVGPQLSRMIVGGLRQARKVHGRADIKADVHTRRVLGRVLLGRMSTTDEATTLSRLVNPADPWELDYPLWSTGREWCSASAPDCPDCPLRKVCAGRE